MTERRGPGAWRSEIPAVVVLVTSPDGVVFEHAEGKLDVAAGLPLRPDAVFRMASMTKPITSAAVMTLVESGKLRLDDPAARYVAALGHVKVATDVKADGSYTARAPRRPITVRDLLTHTSGIGYAFSHPLLFALRERGVSEQDFPLLHDPGESWTYGGGTRYLGDIVEILSGQPLGTYLAKRFFEPLGMADTWFEVPAEAWGRVVTLHRRAGGVLTEQPNPGTPAAGPARGDGGLFSTARDYGKFLRMFLNAGRVGSTRILAEASIDDMTRNQIGRLVVSRQPAADAAQARPFPLGAGRDTWGLGFQVAAPPTSPTQRGAGSYGWAGIANTHFWVDPTRRLGVVLLMQVLPFYDDACTSLLTDLEALVSRFPQ